MRVISLSQPWLWAILDPIARKHIENRSWQPPIEVIGQRIALHAAKSWDEDAIGFFIRLGLDHFPARRELYPTGMILGVATIDRIVSTPKTLPPDQQRWFFGPFGWVLADVRALGSPFTQRGAQGLRHLDPAMADAIERQLAASAEIARQHAQIGGAS